MLISTRNTKVYVQWMLYSFVWLYLIKCVFTCSIFVDSNTNFFLSVLGVFWKYFVFTKTENFKNSVDLFWWLSHGSSKSHAIVVRLRVDFGNLFVSGRSNWEGYTEIFAAQLTTPLRVRHPVAKNTQQIFSKLLTWSVLAGDLGDLLVTCFSHKKCVFCVSRTIFKTFSIFPSNLCDCSLSLSSPFLSQLKLT